MGTLAQSIAELCARPLRQRVDKMRDAAKQLPQLIEQLRAAEEQAEHQLQLRQREINKAQLELDDIERRARSWGERAEQAVDHGDDERARQALRRQMEARSDKRRFARARDAVTEALDQLERALKRLRSYRSEAELRLELAQLEAKSAPAQRAIPQASDRARAGRTRQRATITDELEQLKRREIEERLEALKAQREGSQ